MANWSLDSYETVEERLSRFKADYPNYRMEAVMPRDPEGEIGKTRWVMKVSLWKHMDDPHPVSMGHAFEVDGAGMANKTAALENCETSALGRALANAGYYGNKRVTREEMMKVRMGEIKEQIASAPDEKELRRLFEQWKTEGLAQQVSPLVTARLGELRGGEKNADQ